MGIRFAGWGVGLGERIVTNDDLSTTLETSDDWIQERTGIRERRIGGTASSLGITAAKAAMADAGVTADDIDLVILSTTTGDRLIPGTAPTIAVALGITGGAMDLNAACSGFMYGVAVARGMIATGTQRVLLIGAENLSRWVDWDDRATAVLFGDGAGAVVIEPSEVDSVLSINLGADGSLADIIRCDHGGYIWMDGREVFRRAVRVVVESSERALREAGVTIDEIDILLAHQANLRILHAVADRLGLSHDKIVVCLDKYGNTSSASIPLAVDHARSQQLLSPGKVALMTGFGGGMTWASAVVRWS